MNYLLPSMEAGCSLILLNSGGLVNVVGPSNERAGTGLFFTVARAEVRLLLLGVGARLTRLTWLTWLTWLTGTTGIRGQRTWPSRWFPTSCHVQPARVSGVLV